MQKSMGVEAEVLWWQEGGAWMGVLGDSDHVSLEAAWAGRDNFEVELLLRATDWHVEMSHEASGGFQREHIQAADADEAKAEAADLLRVFSARIEEVASV